MNIDLNSYQYVSTDIKKKIEEPISDGFEGKDDNIKNASYTSKKGNKITFLNLKVLRWTLTKNWLHTGSVKRQQKYVIGIGA